MSADPVLRGEIFYYRGTATNTDSATGATFNDVVVQLTVPQNVAAINRFLISGAVSTTCTWFCTPGQVLSLNLGSLPPGASREFVIPVTAAPDISASALPAPIAATFSGTHDGDPSTQALANENISIVFSRPLELALTANKSPIAPGDDVTYTLTFGNTGVGPLQNVDLELKLPPGVTVIDAGGGTVQGSSVVWTIDSIPAGTGDQRRATLRNQSADTARVLRSEATIHDAFGLDPDGRSSLLTTVRALTPLSVAAALSADPCSGATSFSIGSRCRTATRRRAHRSKM